MTGCVARRCLVSGRVQGVFYRASTRDKAREFGVRGHAKNLSDGRVEVLAVGQLDGVHALVRWLRIGPPAARVTAVDIEEVDLETLVDVPEAFTTR